MMMRKKKMMMRMIARDRGAQIPKRVGAQKLAVKAGASERLARLIMIAGKRAEEDAAAFEKWWKFNGWKEVEAYEKRLARAIWIAALRHEREK